MRVGEVAQRAGVNVETLRYYERGAFVGAGEDAERASALRLRDFAERARGGRLRGVMKRV